MHKSLRLFFITLRRLWALICGYNINTGNNYIHAAPF
nr:MAG TPA: hypothetical protein [Caudoviricetes sp.]